MNRRRIALSVCMFLLAGTLCMFASGSKEKVSKEPGTYPAGKLAIWTYGMPEYMRIYFQDYIDRADTPVKDVTVEMVNYKGEADVRQQVLMDLAAGTLNGLPTAISTFPVSMQVMADAGVLLDLTDKLAPYKDFFIEGAFDQATYKGRIYGIPYTLQPKMLFYNADIFDQYGIDPGRMATMEGYINVGRELNEKSNGKVKLSYVDPGSYTWRYWFRRGLMPQAQAKIWDENGNVVFDKDPGTRLAMTTFSRMLEEGLLLNAAMFSPPLYEATRRGEIATFYVESFWDSYLRNNLADMSGSWRSLPAPVFEDIGTAGAQVIAMYCVIDKPGNAYADLFVDILLDFNLNTKARNEWSDRMIALSYPTEHPIVTNMLADPYWSEPSAYYGGESYKKQVTASFLNPSENLTVTENDAEADVIISSELEKYVAGAQDIETTIKSIGQQLRMRLNLK
ncbi:ABC transporter substrate-binding protein [Parasphaerochaeta coccoides]|uniref:Extracellular solute-binding protein family 1 n=1 Tax=Parasphaerochaeta coccoides (strain ATCC BAA-1237 / DSM 17374 / SPN1) TaxID=760011 RepID=F4GHI5_PARC1|nr:ABC transporter substrate-binding protein [Parasphaerochaeta coccoides]AEC02574.1 extracellular solute-binding protein family 1 [Parasphaerochaeta coccoides DSM 17374]